MKIIHVIISTLALLLFSCSSEKSSFPQKKTTDDKLDQINTLLDKSVALMDSSEFEKASRYLDSLKEVASVREDKVLLAGVLNNQGNLNYRLGRLEQSITLIEKSLAVDREIGDSAAIGAKLKNIGISYKELGKFQTSIRKYRESLEIALALNDSNQVASINNSIGNLYNRLKDYEKAIGYHSDALNVWRALEKREKIALSLGNKGNSLLGMGKIEEAEEVYIETLEMKRLIGKKFSIAITLNNLGEALLKQGEYEKALGLFLESISLREDVGRRDGISIVANNLANLEIKRGNFRIAQNWLNQAKLIIDETGATDKRLENLRLQRDLFGQAGNYEEAYRIGLLYDEMNEKAFKDQVRQVNELQYQYDIDQQEKAKELAETRFQVAQAENRAKQIENTIQGYVITIAFLAIILVSYFAFKLRKKNRHIENLMRELHHRVKNHLGMISGMFGAQSEQGTTSDADLLEEAKTRVEAVNGIHRRLYRQDEYEFVNMQEYLTELVDNSALVFGLYQNIHKELKIDSEPLEIDKAISVGLIANEVLTNAFKYGLQKADKPMLKIVLEKAVKGYRMVISNNAAPDQKPITESTGFGKELIKRLTANLKGESRTIQQNGFQFELTFP